VPLRLRYGRPRVAASPIGKLLGAPTTARASSGARGIFRFRKSYVVVLGESPAGRCTREVTPRGGSRGDCTRELRLENVLRWSSTKKRTKTFPLLRQGQSGDDGRAAPSLIRKFQLPVLAWMAWLLFTFLFLIGFRNSDNRCDSVGVVVHQYGVARGSFTGINKLLVASAEVNTSSARSGGDLHSDDRTSEMPETATPTPAIIKGVPHSP